MLSKNMKPRPNQRAIRIILPLLQYQTPAVKEPKKKIINLLKTKLAEKMNNLFPSFISEYRESCNTQHVLISLTEEQRKNLNSKYIIGAFVMDLLKAIDCTPHDLVIIMLAVYRFEKNILRYIYSHLKSTKQCVSVNNIKSTFELIISEVP